MTARLQTLAANLMLCAAGKRALHALHFRGVRVAPIKGAWLLQRAGSDLTARPMADIDLIVDPKSRDAADAAMQHEGFVRQYRRPDRPYTDRTNWEFNYILRTGKLTTCVELHFALSPTGWIALSTTELLDRARPSSFGDVPCLQLTDEDSVCVILYHIGHHGFAIGERAFRDLADLRRAGLLDDVPGILGRCQHWGCGIIAWTALDLMNSAFPEVAVDLPARFAPPPLVRGYLRLVLRRGVFPACPEFVQPRWRRLVHRCFLADSMRLRAMVLLDPPYRFVRDRLETAAAGFRPCGFTALGCW